MGDETDNIPHARTPLISLNCYRIVRDRISSALIMEDDADWDVNLKKQLQGFAAASRSVQYGNGAPHSPYGDDWDILWLGHCGINCRPGPIHVSPDDITIVPVHRLPPYYRNPPPGSANNTRVVCRAEGGVCTLGYAITYLGAQKLLSALSLTPEGGGAPFDLALSGYCQTGWLKCIAPYPSILGVWRPAGPLSRQSDIHSVDGYQEKEAPMGAVYSTMYNMHRILAGETTVHAVVEDTAIPELDPSQFKVPNGTLKFFDENGLH